jgi:uncharacterized BrkB/YihY/UPF0761 family membrane protein
MIQQIKAIIGGITDSTLFLITGGFIGALMYARQHKLKLWEAVTAVALGTASSAALGPFIVHYFGLQNQNSAYAAIGFIIGMLVKEVAELIFKLLDELQANPKLLTDFINKMRKK